MQIDKHHCEECAYLVEYFGEEDYTDYPQWTDFILKWNKAQDVMGIKQTLWVLRLDFGWKKSLSCLLYTSPSPRDKRQSRMPSSA